MNDRKWYDSSQPQTLQGAQILLYLNCLWLLIGAFGGGISIIGLVLIAGLLYGAIGIANEKRMAYRIAVVVSALVLVFLIYILAATHGFATIGVINLLFQIALVAMLVHPQSREYEKIWFR